MDVVFLQLLQEFKVLVDISPTIGQILQLIGDKKLSYFYLFSSQVMLLSQICDDGHELLQLLLQYRDLINGRPLTLSLLSFWFLNEHDIYFEEVVDSHDELWKKHLLLQRLWPEVSDYIQEELL